MRSNRTIDRIRCGGGVAAGVMVMALLVSCGGGAAEGGGPIPDVEGWTQQGEVRVFDADNLWEYINGAAELYVEYDVLTCATADLTAGDVTVTVDLYDMGTPLNAFGVFSRERSGDAIPVPGATEALFSPPYMALMLKGSSYVKVNVLQGDLTAEDATALLQGLAGGLPGSAGYPAEIELLPAAGRVANTEGFQRDGFLGLTELNDCLFAEYADAEGNRWQGFVMLPGEGAASASSTWAALEQDWGTIDGGGITELRRDVAHPVLYRDIPYQGLVGIVQMGEHIMGVSGAENQLELLSRLDGFLP